MPTSDEIKIYRFTRALFGLTSSPFLLAGVLNQHLDPWKDRYPTVVKELQDGLYVDDLMAGGVTVEETSEKKAKAMEVFEDATFSIHKWHSNAEELEGNGETSQESEDESTYAKQQLGGGECIGGKLLVKSRVAKRNLTIPRLELIAGHMAVNLVTNVEAALSNYQIATHCWLDSTVALYWIQGRGDHRQFVANRVSKIQQHDHVTWHHVPISQNPADLGSRGGAVEDDQRRTYLAE